MNSITKRLVQMGALYVGKQLWSRFDAEAAQQVASDLYRSTPHDWEVAARDGLSSVRSGAAQNLDQALGQVGLMRRSQASGNVSAIVLGATAGAALTVAGGYILFGTQAGTDFRRELAKRFSSEVERLEDADHGMTATSEVSKPRVVESPENVSGPTDVTPPN